MKVIAHRGARDEAPENTNASFRRALSLPVYGVEFDVTLTSDKQPIVIHQESLCLSEDNTRLTPAPIDGTRQWTNRYSSSFVETLDAGAWYGDGFAGERIPHLRDVLELSWAEKHLYVEIKDPSWWRGESDTSWITSVLNAIEPLVLAFEQTRAFHFLSFSPDVLAACRERFPSIPRVLNVWPLPFVDRGWLRATANTLDLETVQFAETLVLEDSDWVSLVKGEIGASVFVFEMTPAGVSRHSHEWQSGGRRAVWEKLLSLPIDGMTTDFPSSLLSYLSDCGGSD